MARFPRPFLFLSVFVCVLLVVLPACSGAAPAPAPAAPTASGGATAPVAPVGKVTEYNIASFTDMSGPSADLARPVEPARKAIVAYWNDTKGKELGIKINRSTYDNRYDPTVTVSLWPGILANEKPIALIGMTGSDASALGQRLVDDKVAMFLGGGGMGTNWLPNQWVFFSQTSYPHQIAGFLNWRQTNWKEARAMRVGNIASQQTPSYTDLQKGTQTFLDKGVFPGKAEYAGVEWVSLAATDVSSEVKRLIDKKTDYIVAFIPTPIILSMMRAIEVYKADTKLLFLGGLGLTQVAQAGQLRDFEGFFETSALASAAETETEGYKIYQQYKDQVGAGNTPWGGVSALGMMSALLPLRAVERAAKAVGPDKITGEAMYNAMYGAPFTNKDLLGLSGDLTFTKDAAFPTTGLKVRLSTVKDGKFQLVTPEWVSAPELPKW